MAATRGHAAGRTRAPALAPAARRARSRGAHRRPDERDLARTQARLRDVIEPLARSAGTILKTFRWYGWDAARGPGDVDRDGGVGLDAVAEPVPRHLRTALTMPNQRPAEFIAGNISSRCRRPDGPAADRAAYWRGNVGRLVMVRLGGHLGTGRLIAADDAGPRSPWTVSIRPIRTRTWGLEDRIDSAGGPRSTTTTWVDSDGEAPTTTPATTSATATPRMSEQIVVGLDDDDVSDAKHDADNGDDAGDTARRTNGETLIWPPSVALEARAGNPGWRRIISAIETRS